MQEDSPIVSVITFEETGSRFDINRQVALETVLAHWKLVEGKESTQMNSNIGTLILTLRSYEDFKNISNTPQICHLHYDNYEKNRISKIDLISGLLQIVKDAREEIKSELLTGLCRPSKYLTPIKELIKKPDSVKQKGEKIESKRRSIGSNKEIRAQSTGLRSSTQSSNPYDVQVYLKSAGVIKKSKITQKQRQIEKDKRKFHMMAFEEQMRIKRKMKQEEERLRSIEKEFRAAKLEHEREIEQRNEVIEYTRKKHQLEVQKIKEEKKKAELEYLRDIIEKANETNKSIEREKQRKLYMQERDNERAMKAQEMEHKQKQMYIEREMQLKMEQYKFEQRMESRNVKKKREEQERERNKQSRDKARKERIQRAFQNYESKLQRIRSKLQLREQRSHSPLPTKPYFDIRKKRDRPHTRQSLQETRDITDISPSSNRGVNDTQLFNTTHSYIRPRTTAPSVREQKSADRMSKEKRGSFENVIYDDQFVRQKDEEIERRVKRIQEENSRQIRIKRAKNIMKQQRALSEKSRKERKLRFKQKLTNLRISYNNERVHELAISKEAIKSDRYYSAMVERLKKFFLKEKMIEMRMSKSFRTQQLDSLATQFKQFEHQDPLSQSFSKQRLSCALSFAQNNWKKQDFQLSGIITSRKEAKLGHMEQAGVLAHSKQAL